MKFLAFVLVSIFLHLSVSFQDTEDLTLRINDGEILGRYITSHTGRTISAFMGIPFARSPVGELRFRSPQKVVPWNGTLPTQNEAPMCPQMDFLNGQVGGDEDCLYLTVYVPETSTSELLDVLVWIHGGAFVLGSSGTAFGYGPDYLLDHDVILVAGNYRLGLLGFLSTEDEHATGNFGLKDQNFLLQWVQENIEHFGGNANSVTIWGESAGAVSVHYHMISPMSRGLFHKAIIHSGTLNNAWADPPRRGVARQQTFNLAQHVGCLTEDQTTQQIVECLRTRSPQEIVGFNSAAPYPVVEYSEGTEEAFIGERNYEELHANSVEIPVMLGMNSEEGLLTAATFLINDLALDNLISNWNEVLPNRFGYDHLSAEERAVITNKINEFYFGRESTPTNQQIDRQHLIDLFTDGSFIGTVETIQHRLSHSNHQSTYLYHYTHKGTASISFAAEEFFGTSHADELIPLFTMREVALYSSIPSELDMELTRNMSLMWTNFVRTGNPTPIGSTTPIWPLATEFPLDYLQIGNENGKFDGQILQPRVDFYPQRANFWIELRNEHRLSSWLDDGSGSSSASSHYSFSFIGCLVICWYFVNGR